MQLVKIIAIVRLFIAYKISSTITNIDFCYSELTLTQQYTNIIILVGFVIALIVHGQQTEATYRLDFVWKLQATGKYLHFYCIRLFILCNYHFILKLRTSVSYKMLFNIIFHIFILEF